jgi:hypothetical protein
MKFHGPTRIKDAIAIAAHKSHRLFAVTEPLAEARACMLCIRVIPAKSTPEASNQTADAEEVEEDESNNLF